MAGDRPILTCGGPFIGSMNSGCVVKSAGVNHRVMSASFLMAIDATPANMASPIRACYIWCREARRRTRLVLHLGIPAVTLWVCSIDNLKRQETEVSAILAAVKSKIAALAKDPAIHSRRVRIKAVGRLDLLPSTLVTVLREAEQATVNYDSLKLTIAIAYGGHEEIADAVRDLVRQKVQHGVDLDAIIDEITPSAIAEHLYTVGLPISTSSSARAARSVCPGSCCGKAFTVSSISPM